MHVLTHSNYAYTCEAHRLNSIAVRLSIFPLKNNSKYLCKENCLMLTGAFNDSTGAEKNIHWKAQFCTVLMLKKYQQMHLLKNWFSAVNTIIIWKNPTNRSDELPKNLRKKFYASVSPKVLISMIWFNVSAKQKVKRLTAWVSQFSQGGYELRYLESTTPSCNI